MNSPAEQTTISVAQVKNRPVAFTMARLQGAQAAGVAQLTVLNRGRPTLYLGLADDLPERWRSPELATLPLSDLRRSKVSFIGLRQRRQALLLSQRGGPSLALWPLEDDDAGAVAEQAPISTAGEAAELRRRVARLEKRLEGLEHTLAILGKLAARLYGSPASGSKAKKPGTQL